MVRSQNPNSDFGNPKTGLHGFWSLKVFGVNSVFILASAAMLLSLSSMKNDESSGLWKKVSVKHVLAGMSSFAAQSMAGQALVLLRFNTVQLFKSSKVAFVMLLSYLFLDSPISKVGITLATLMSFGLFVTSNADIKSVTNDRSDSLIGFAFISTSLVLSAFAR